MYSFSYKSDSDKEYAVNSIEVKMDDSATAYDMIASFVNFLSMNGYQEKSLIEALGDTLEEVSTNGARSVGIYF